MKKTLIITALLLLGTSVLADAIPVTNTPIIRQGAHPDLGPVTAGTDYLAEMAHLAPQPVYNSMPPMYNIYGGLNGYGPITPAFGSCVTNPYGGTAVAYEDNQGNLVVSQNQWSRTTASHLTYIDKGAVEDRIPYEEFKKELKRAIERELKYD